MPFCRNCGSELQCGAKFCPNCGAAVELIPTVAGCQALMGAC